MELTDIACPVLTPVDSGWDAARLGWNTAADRAPALIAAPRTADDVVAVVKYAHGNGLRVAPQNTGHNAGSLGPLDDAVLVSMGHMTGLSVDPDTATARAEAGVLWGSVSAAIDPHGMYALSGSSTVVGVAGYTLGGGLSMMGRTHGIAANHVTAVEVVKPDSERLRVTHDSDPELFWGLRGGGANFGVVTAIEFGLFRHASVTAGMFVWPYERRLEVLAGWHGWTATASDAATTSFRVIHFPPVPELPPALSGQKVVVIDGVIVGDSPDELLAPLRAMRPDTDTWSPRTPAGLDNLHLDPAAPTPALSATALLDDLDAAGLGAVAQALPEGNPLLFVELRHLGGALATGPADGGATASLPGRYSLGSVGVGMPPDFPAIDAALNEVIAAVAPYVNGKAFANFAERPTDARNLYSDAAFQRLQRLRTVVDPGDLMLAGHPIPLPHC